MLLLLLLTVIFSDAAKTKPLFIPAEAFNAPRRFGLSKTALAQIDRDMTRVAGGEAAIGDEAECATAEPQPRGEVDASGTVIELMAGWNAERHLVTTLARVRLTSGEEVLVEFPFGSMQLGRTTWCTGDTRLKTGDAIGFNAKRAASEPPRLIATAVHRPEMVTPGC